mgnify:CR=1 FL=1
MGRLLHAGEQRRPQLRLGEEQRLAAVVGQLVLVRPGQRSRRASLDAQPAYAADSDVDRVQARRHPPRAPATGRASRARLASRAAGSARHGRSTRAQLVAGWIHTGDNGRIDAHGFLHYRGRQKEMIKVNGMSVSPADVEMLLTQHPAVESVAVGSTYDAGTGQRPAAFNVPKPCVEGNNARNRE